ncbi:MAG: hypothetical protein RML38_04790 [Bacteroidia bacterium]|nr:hypothetical protein [Bacteroidia bacterium]
MKTSFLIILVFISQWTFSQSQNWSKDDRNSIFNEFMNLLSEYNNISNDQKESISLCCLEEITKKYNKDDFKSKIDIEIKRIQQATITQCATNIGVDLSNIKVEKKQEQKSTTELKLSGFKKEDFEGVWNFEFGTYTFYSVDGEFKINTLPIKM